MSIPALHDDETIARMRQARLARERAEHDRRVEIHTANELRRAYEAEVARRALPKPERKPGQGEVPAWRFGPRDRSACGS